MSNRPVNLLLNDIHEAMGRITRYTAGMSFESFKTDEKTIDAVVRNMEIMGEAANRLSDEFQEAHANIEWHKIVGLRNRIVHEYFGIDIDIIWEILKRDLPPLLSNLQRLRG
jgi:uncharacterized protein with HEPN domain